MGRSQPRSTSSNKRTARNTKHDDCRARTAASRPTTLVLLVVTPKSSHNPDAKSAWSKLPPFVRFVVLLLLLELTALVAFGIWLLAGVTKWDLGTFGLVSGAASILGATLTAFQLSLRP